MWHERIGFLLPNRWKFQWRYWRRQTPWDTQVTPPEVMEFIARTPPGKALDLGCGTGTNAITLARHGWRVTGVDFIPKAISAARAKAARSGVAIEFLVANVTDLSALSGPFDYVLDIGCLHALKAEDRSRYATNMSRMLRPQAWYMLYAWLPRPWKGGCRHPDRRGRNLAARGFLQSTDGDRRRERQPLLVVLVSAALRGGISVFPFFADIADIECLPTGAR